MPAIRFEEAGLGAYLSKPTSMFTLDLSRATLMEVLSAYEEHKQRVNSNYTCSNIIALIKGIEDKFGCTLQPTQVTDEFWNLCISYLIGKGLRPSTIKTYCDQIHAALVWSARHRCALSTTVDCYKVEKYNREQIALTAHQMSTIYTFDIDALKIRKDRRENLKIARDMLILSCSLGQRYSDMVRITPLCFNADKTKFSIVQQKTGNKAVVDIKKFSFDESVTREILERYEYYAPHAEGKAPMNKMTYNECIKHLCRLIGGAFNQEVITENKIRGQIVTESAPLWSLLSSHTGRRSMITYNVKKKLPEYEIRRASGHSDSRTFQRYIIYDD